MSNKPYLSNEVTMKFEKGRLSDQMSVPKDKAEALKKLEYVLGLYLMDGLYVRPGGIVSERPISELRQYSRGSQSEDRYRKLIDHKIKSGADPNAKEKSLLNISWANAMVMPKYVEQAMTKTYNEHDPVVTAMDSASNFERQLAINKDRIKSRPQMRGLMQQANMPIKYEANIPAIDGEMDVDFAIKMRGYVLGFEARMEDILRASLVTSGYDTIGEMLSRDMIDTNLIAADTEFHEDTRRVSVNYIDIANLIIPASKFPDFRDAAFVGSVDTTNIGNIADEVIREGYTMDDLKHAASRYGGYYPNARLSAENGSLKGYGSRRELSEDTGRTIYDPYTVDIMTLKWKCYDEELKCQKIYRAKWVIGTKIIWAYGEDKCIGYGGSPGNMEAMLPAVVYRVDGPSLVDRCVSHINDLQEAVLRLRAFRAELPPGIMMSIDLRLLSNVVDLGTGKSFNMLEILDIFASKGKLFYESINPHESGEPGSSRKPIESISASVMDQYNMYVSAINSALEMIRGVTGMNEVADGTANPNDMLNGVGQMMQQSSNNVLATFTRAHARFSARLFTVMARRYQTAVVDGDIEFDSIAASSTSVMTAKIGKEVLGRTLVIDARPLPKQAEIEMMQQVAVSKNQTGEITVSDLLIIMDMLNRKELKAAQLYLSKAVDKNNQMKAAQQQQLMAAQSEAQSQQALALNESEKSKEAMKYEMEAKLEQIRHINKMEELKLAAQLQSEAAVANNFVNNN